MVNCVKPAKKDDILKLLGEIDVNNTVRKYYEDAPEEIGQPDIGRQDLKDSDEED